MRANTTTALLVVVALLLSLNLVATTSPAADNDEPANANGPPVPTIVKLLPLTPAKYFRVWSDGRVDTLDRPVGPNCDFVLEFASGPVEHPFPVIDAIFAGGHTSQGIMLTYEDGRVDLLARIALGSDHLLAGNHIHDCIGPGLKVMSADNCVVDGNLIANNSNGGNGGGIQIDASEGIALTNNTITGNSASDYAGGVSVLGSGNISLIGNTISDNTTPGHAGGVSLSGSTDSTLIGNTISGNSATGVGGGIWATGSPAAVISDNCIMDNASASRGGGIYAIGCHLWTLTNNKILNNSSSQDPGAMYIDTSDNWILSGNDIICNDSVSGEVGGIWVLGNSMNLTLTGDPGLEVFNRITGNTGCQIRNTNSFGQKPGANTAATYVDWGTNEPTVIEDGICDFFDNFTWAVVVWSPAAPGSNSPDITCDCIVGIDDFLSLLKMWGPCPDALAPCPADLDCDGEVGILDFLILLAAWG